MQPLRHSRSTFVTILHWRDSFGEYKHGTLDEICFCEAIHVTIAPLPAPTLLPHTHTHLGAEVAANALQKAKIKNLALLNLVLIIVCSPIPWLPLHVNV